MGRLECSNPDCGCHGCLRPDYVCPNYQPIELPLDAWKKILEEDDYYDE